MFSVKSAYNLALTLKERKEEGGQSSGGAYGERKLWNVIWRAIVPKKIRIFVWRAASNSLALHVNSVKHHQATSGRCSICGLEDESTFHALVTCPTARALRMELRGLWNLPREEVFKCSWPEWLLIILLDRSKQVGHQNKFTGS